MTHPFTSRPHGTMLRLSLPVLFSLIAEPLTGLVDTAFVARLGAVPLAGLGIATALLTGSVWIFNFVGIGTQTEVAHADGSEDRDGLGRAASTGVAVGGMLGVFFAAAAYLVAEPAVRWMGAAGEVVPAGRTYLEIRLLGAPAMLITFSAFGALRGMQDMRTPLYVAVVVNAINIVLDAVLIFGAGPIPAFGIRGAAWATTASHWLGALASVAAVRRSAGLSLSVRLHEAKGLLVVGRDLFLRTGLLLLFLVLATRAANRISPEAGAAHQAIRQVWVFTALLLDAYAHTAQSLIGYFLGRAHTREALRVAAVATVWALATGLTLAAGMLLATPLVERGFVPPAAWSVFHAAWLVAALSQPFNALSFVTDGIHWGTRDFRFLRNAMLVSTGIGVGLLLLLEATGRDDFVLVWIVTGAWIIARAALGTARIWPGIGAAPLRRD